MFPSRAAIIVEARSWIGTAFHHQGRVKKTGGHKGGCDCIGLIIGVARALQIAGADGVMLADCDVIGYGRFPDGIRLYQALRFHLQEISLSQAQPADIVLFRFDENPQHVGFISDYPEAGSLGLIHCYAQVRRVVEHRLDALWQEKQVAAFSFRGMI